MIPVTTLDEANWMTACPACGAHKGTGRALCVECAYTRKDIIPYGHCNLPWEQWLRYSLSETKILDIKSLLEPGDLMA
jgi:hypothetical protein